MQILLVIVHVVICFILIAVILLQAGKGQGLAGASFSAGNVQSLFGTRAADFLTKATTVSAILFLFTCIGLDIIETQRSKSLFERKRPAVPVDVQQIQKVLERIKTGEAVIPKPEATATVQKAAPQKNPTTPKQTGSAVPQEKRG